MNKTFLIITIVLISCSCSHKQEIYEKSKIECSIFPMDYYTGNIEFWVMGHREFTFSAYFVSYDEISNVVKDDFDINSDIPEKETAISLELKDYQRYDKIEYMAAHADNGFKLTCDKMFLNVQAGADISHLFRVYPLAEFSYPEFSLRRKCYNSNDAPTLYEYLNNRSLWAERNSTSGLFFAPIEAPELSQYAEGEQVTFILSIPFVGLKSDGTEEHKTFNGSFSFYPNLPEEPDMI